MTQQEAFTNCKDAWNAHSWSQDETAEWFAWCAMFPIKNYLGEVCHLFPYIAFLKVNIPRVMLLESIEYTPIW